MTTHTTLGRIPKRRRSEIFWLLGYSVVIVAASIFIIDMLARAWMEWGFTRHVLQGTVNAFELDVNTFYWMLTGLFVGLLFIPILDTYRRIQGVILWVGVIIGSVVLLEYGVGIGPLLEYRTTEGIIVFVLFSVLGAAAAGVRPDDLKFGTIRRYDNGVRLLFGTVLVFVTFGFLESTLIYDSPVISTSSGIEMTDWQYYGVNGDHLIFDLTATTFGLLAFRKFTQYRSSAKMLLIGPQRSGKSAAFGGLHLAVTDTIDPTADLKSNLKVRGLKDKIEQGQFPPHTAAGESYLLKINFHLGGLFPQDAKLNTIDYSGELLDQIFSPILPDDASLNPVNSADRTAQTDGGLIQDEENEDDSSEFNFSYEHQEDDIEGTSSRDGEFAHGTAKNWKDAVEKVEHATAGPQVAGPVWDCIRHADTILLTVPVTDFLTPAVNRGNEPDYANVIRNDNGYSEKEVREYNNIGANKKLNEFEYDSGVYYLVDDSIRVSPEEYLDWYIELIKEFPGKEFIVVGTMADYAKKDFQQEYTGIDGVVDPLNHYDEFCEYVYEEFFLHKFGKLRGIVETIDSDQIYLLWYDIDEDASEDHDKLRIDKSRRMTKRGETGTILRGATELIDRLT